MNQNLIVYCLLLLISCNSIPAPQKPIVRASSISKDMMSWLLYERDYVFWSANYITLDPDLRPISKHEFLERLITGSYLPLRLQRSDSALCYQLYKFDKSVDDDIRQAISEKSRKVLKYYEMEGKPISGLNATDLKGNVYNYENTRGKVLVLNCWFLSCTPCKAEIPDLNKLVERFADRKDVIFLALAFDPAEELRKFLQETTFNYTVIPDQEDFLMKQLRITGYPTHLLVNKKGEIVKVETDFNQFTSFLEKELSIVSR